MDDRPLKILASGRDGDIFEFAPGLVLRKTRDGRSIAHEARIMRYVAEHGLPGAAHRGGARRRHRDRDGAHRRPDHDGRDGAAAVEARRPPAACSPICTISCTRSTAPDWLPGMPDGGDRLLHLDLHPLNVIMSPNGPVVIDWPNARARRSDGRRRAHVRADLVRAHPAAAPGRARRSTRCAPRCCGACSRGATSGRAFYQRVAEMAELKCFDQNMAPDEIRGACGALGERGAAAKAPG